MKFGKIHSTISILFVTKLKTIIAEVDKANIKLGRSTVIFPRSEPKLQ
jgi:hypothetical protein